MKKEIVTISFTMQTGFSKAELKANGMEPHVSISRISLDPVDPKKSGQGAPRTSTSSIPLRKADKKLQAKINAVLADIEKAM